MKKMTQTQIQAQNRLVGEMPGMSGAEVVSVLKSFSPKSYCARNTFKTFNGFTVKTHKCTGGSYCRGNCKPKK